MVLQRLLPIERALAQQGYHPGTTLTSGFLRRTADGATSPHDCERELGIPSFHRARAPQPVDPRPNDGHRFSSLRHHHTRPSPPSGAASGPRRHGPPRVFTTTTTTGIPRLLRPTPAPPTEQHRAIRARTSQCLPANPRHRTSPGASIQRTSAACKATRRPPLLRRPPTAALHAQAYLPPGDPRLATPPQPHRPKGQPQQCRKSEIKK